MQNAAFYATINTGLARQIPTTQAVVYADINTGLARQIPTTQAVVYADINTGWYPQTYTTAAAIYSYLNLGLPTPEQRTVVRGPRGWGILPVDKKEFTVFTDESKGKTYAYVYTKEPL